MHPQLPVVLILSAVWGVSVAVFMEYTELGDFLSKKLTWFMTALGSGGVLLLLLLVTDSNGHLAWWYIPAAFGVSSIGPSFRGLWQHKNIFMDWIRDARHDTTT